MTEGIWGVDPFPGLVAGLFGVNARARHWMNFYVLFRARMACAKMAALGQFDAK
ncbi:MAG: hypothetical protein H0X36_13520 [Sphingomonadaceae bacterium]|nr:hypothetical protein [Sphingomonadaceae bacterium]